MVRSSAGRRLQLPHVVHTHRLRKPFGSRRVLPPVGPVPKHPGTTAPGTRAPAPLPGSRQTPPSSPVRRGAILLPKASRKDAKTAPGRGVSEEGVRGQGHEGAIVTRPERSRGLVGQAQGGAGACRAGCCWEGRRGTWVISARGQGRAGEARLSF